MIKLDDPPQGWANPTDCGAFPCTAPNNIVMQFSGTQFTGNDRPVKSQDDFTIVSDIPSATNAYSRCETNRSWNAAWCQNDNIGVLLFESLDNDKNDRSL